MLGEVAQLSYARADRALAAALHMRQAVKPLNNRSMRAIFERALAHVSSNAGYMIAPAHCPSWAMDYQGKWYVILSGSSDAHFRDGMRILGEHVWYTMTNDQSSVRAADFGRAFRAVLLFGVTH